MSRVHTVLFSLFPEERQRERRRNQAKLALLKLRLMGSAYSEVIVRGAVVALFLILTAPFCAGLTDSRDGSESLSTHSKLLLAHYL